MTFDNLITFLDLVSKQNMILVDLEDANGASAFRLVLSSSDRSVSKPPHPLQSLSQNALKNLRLSESQFHFFFQLHPLRLFHVRISPRSQCLTVAVWRGYLDSKLAITIFLYSLKVNRRCSFLRVSFGLKGQTFRILTWATLLKLKRQSYCIDCSYQYPFSISPSTNARLSQTAWISCH